MLESTQKLVVPWLHLRAQRQKCIISRHRVQWPPRRSRLASYRRKSLLQLRRLRRGRAKLTAQAIGAHVSKL